MLLTNKNIILCKSNKNITWFKGHVSREDRELLHGHRGIVVWFTGLSASGKSTIAYLIEKELCSRGCSAYVFDGDNIRHGLSSDLSFSDEDRKENVRRIGEMVKLFVDAGLIVLTAFISPFKADRERVRSIFRPSEFIEVYISCPVEVCSFRDYKGIYRKALAGEINNFTGISAPYEAPDHPEIIIYSDQTSAQEASKKILNYLIPHISIPEIANAQRG